jgi:hypothetical protein
LWKGSKNIFMEEIAKPFATGCRYCGDTTKRLTRGLCSAHFSKFNRKFNKLATKSADEAKAFEEKCIAGGWIEAKKTGGRPAALDPFEILVREVEAEFKRDIDAALARDEAKQAKEELKKRATKKPGSRKAN